MIPYSKQLIDQEDIDAVVEAMQSDFLTGGPKVREFEEAIANYTGRKYAVTFNSATSALHAAYYVAGISKGDTIITTPISFVATSNAALYLDADVLFVDVLPDGNIDASLVESMINEETKAIVPVDFGGKSVDIKELREIADRHGIYLIEDACHALGSEIEGEKVGFWSDMTIYSFHAIKPITTFEGGALVTDDEALYQKAKRFSSHGMEKKELYKSDMLHLGFNYRLSDVACALGISQLKKLDSFLQKRGEIAARYEEAFKDNPFFETIHVGHKSSYHLYPILLHDLSKRDALFMKLRKKGLGVQVHYRPIYENSFYVEKYGTQFFENADYFYRRMISLPCHQGMSQEEVEYVIDSVQKSLEEV